jgi:hypothetical protein
MTVRQPSSPVDAISGQERQEESGPELLKVLRGIYDDGEEDPRPKRGKIHEWSSPSRRNFRKYLGGMLLGALDGAMMVGLTYPLEFPDPESHEVYKGHLRALKARFQREFPLGSFVWKLEFQKRGAAHYHLIVFGLGEGPAALQSWKDWVDRAWYEVVGSGDEKHLAAGVNSKWVESVGGAVGYLVKYLGKDDQTRPGDFTGRYWGYCNKKTLPLAPVRKEEITEREAVLTRRVFRKIIESQIKQRRMKRTVERIGVWHQFGATAMDVEAWHANPGCERFLPRVTPQFTGPTRLNFPQPSTEFGVVPSLPFRMPPKYKCRQNHTITLFCDASKVAAQLKAWLLTMGPAIAGRRPMPSLPGQGSRERGREGGDSAGLSLTDGNPF